MAKRQRLDLLIASLDLFQSREEARTAIIDGGILVNGVKITKPGVSVDSSARVEIDPGWRTKRYVSRGGVKLESALAAFNIDPKGLICLDVGASTGGFTDCLLKHGAALVYAVDVGYGQLDWTLRQQSKVVVKERTNARYLTPETLYRQDDPMAQLAVIDVSFISLKKVLPACLSVLSEDADLVCLVKPQFEAGRTQVGKGGVVRSPAVHKSVLDAVSQEATELALSINGLTHSPLLGPSGNIEFLMHLTRRSVQDAFDISRVVEEAHRVLDKSSAANTAV